MTDGKKDQLKRKKTLEYELRRLYRAGELQCSGKRAWDHPGLDVGCVQYGAAGQMGRNQKSVLLF